LMAPGPPCFFITTPADHTIKCSQWKRVKTGKAVPVTGRGGPQGCETSRFPYFLDNWLTDGKVISLTRRPADL
jgi:hypothetical protein